MRQSNPGASSWSASRLGSPRADATCVEGGWLRVEWKASLSLTARSLGDLDDGPVRAGVAAWGNSARSGIRASEHTEKVEA